MKRASVYVIYDWYSTHGYYIETRRHFVGEMYGEEYNRVVQLINDAPEIYRNIRWENA